jgi:hypothetical protein
MYHIYTTYASDNEYIRYSEHGPRGVNVAERSVLIKGGTGVNRKNLGTPLGVHTTISDDDYEWLKDDYSFKEHVKNGYVTVQKHKVEAEVVAADMPTRQWVKDAQGNVVRGDSFPVAPQDFSDKPAGDGLTAIEPKTNKKSKAA